MPKPVNKPFPACAPKVSIVIPSLNQGRFLAATLDSIISQGYPNLELIVVDGASTDHSLTVIKQYEPHITWWVSEPDKGQTQAINKGFRQATGEIMAWINSDDMVAPGALQAIVEHFHAHPETDVMYGNRILINDEGMEIGRWILPPHSPSVLKWVDYVPQETLYWRKRAWERVGNSLDETFHFAMDWDLLLRFTKERLRVERLPRFLGLFRVHCSQKTATQISYVGMDEMLKLRERELGHAPSRLKMALYVAPYLAAARLTEIAYRLGKQRSALESL